MTDYKNVPAKALKKGDIFYKWHTNASNHYAKAEVVEISGAMIKLLIYGTREETFSTEDFYAEIELTTDEFRAKYHKDAEKVVGQLENQISNIEEIIGYHEMWNGWIETDPWEFGKSCREHNLEILGWFYLDQIKDWGILEMDIGIAATDGEDKFWCHACKSWIDHLQETWAEYKSK